MTKISVISMINRSIKVAILFTAFRLFRNIIITKYKTTIKFSVIMLLCREILYGYRNNFKDKITLLFLIKK